MLRLKTLFPRLFHHADQFLPGFRRRRFLGREDLDVARALDDKQDGGRFAVEFAERLVVEIVGQLGRFHDVAVRVLFSQSEAGNVCVEQQSGTEVGGSLFLSRAAGRLRG